jgi:hypothetical protein
LHLFDLCIFFAEYLGLFDLLANNLSIVRPNSTLRFTSEDVENAFIIRLVASVTEFHQHSVDDYFKDSSTCPYSMPLGRDCFKLLNAHIDGSSKNSRDTDSISRLETLLINSMVATFRSVVAPNNIWNFDELMFPHVTLRDPLVAYIPRKPHSLGIIAYLAAIRFSHTKLPFVMFINPWNVRTTRISVFSLCCERYHQYVSFFLVIFRYFRSVTSR